MADKDTNKEALLHPEEGVEENVSDSNEDTSDPSDKLTPDHPRFKQVYQDMKEYKADSEAKEQQLRDIRSEMEELKAQINQRQDDTGDEGLTAEERAAISKIDRELKKMGYMTRDQAEERDRIVTRKIEFDKLSSKYDGSTGYPKFKAEEVLAHAKAKGFGENYESAYRDLHFDVIVRQEAKRSQTPEPPTSESPASDERTIPQTELTPEQIDKMSPQEWEEHREKVLQGVKESTR